MFGKPLREIVEIVVVCALLALITFGIFNQVKNGGETAVEATGQIVAAANNEDIVSASEVRAKIRNQSISGISIRIDDTGGDLISSSPNVSDVDMDWYEITNENYNGDVLSSITYQEVSN